MHELEDFIAWLSRQTPYAEFDEMRERLGCIPLDTLVRDEWMLQHVLGFVQLRLPSPYGREIRIHHWRADGEFSEEPHTHLWDLVSYVLQGSIKCKTFNVKASRGPGDHLFAVERFAHGGTDRTDTGEIVSATEIASSECHAGEIYIVPQGTFHVSSPGPNGALTLIITSAELVANPMVVSRPTARRAGYTPRTPTSGEERLRFVDALRQALT